MSDGAGGRCGAIMRFSLRLLVDVAAPAFFMCGIVYFGYGAALGATGYKTLQALRVEVEQKSAEVDALAEKRRRLEIVARQLNPKSLDPDLVDEKIRTVLGYVDENDVVVPRDQLEEILSEAVERRDL